MKNRIKELRERKGIGQNFDGFEEGQDFTSVTTVTVIQNQKDQDSTSVSIDTVVKSGNGTVRKYGRLYMETSKLPC